MKVKVIVHGHAVEYFPDKREQFDYTFEEGQTVQGMLGELGIIPELVMKIVADGKPVTKGYVLRDGETLVLLTPVAGG
ncbi:MAG: MoaD/ThiS family protein [Bacillota bacterium]|jgi:sulfur carrier protein ThiS|nr:MoaD/ThiS family protein [Bacillota bacterium]